MFLLFLILFDFVLSNPGKIHKQKKIFSSSNWWKNLHVAKYLRFDLTVVWFWDNNIRTGVKNVNICDLKHTCEKKMHSSALLAILISQNEPHVLWLLRQESEQSVCLSVCLYIYFYQMNHTKSARKLLHGVEPIQWHDQNASLPNTIRLKKKTRFWIANFIYESNKNLLKS